MLWHKRFAPRNGSTLSLGAIARLPGREAIRRRNSEHRIEEVGKKLRAMMPWIANNKLVDVTKN